MISSDSAALLVIVELRQQIADRDEQIAQLQAELKHRSTEEPRG